MAFPDFQTDFPPDVTMARRHGGPDDAASGVRPWLLRQISGAGVKGLVQAQGFHGDN